MLNVLRVFLIAVCFQLHLASAKGHGFVPRVPSECQDLGYCDQPLPEYPREVVNKLVQESGLVSPGVVDVTMQSRRHPMDKDPAEVNLCDYVVRTIIPQVARATNGKWHYVVNTLRDYKQSFRVEICTNVNSQCSQVAHFYAGYTASCQQRFITRVLVALDEKGQKINAEFQIPSNCYCQVKQE